MNWLHDLKAVLQEYGIIEYVFPLLALFLINLGSVYSGRLLGLSKNEDTKNRIAVVSILLSCILFTIDEISELGVLPGIIHYLLLAGTSIVLYTIIGKNLYKRIDNKLDKWIGQDGEDPANNKSKDNDKISLEEDEDENEDKEIRKKSKRNRNSININIHNCKEEDNQE